MTGTAATRDVPGGEPVMSIGEVLSRLRPDFPDVTISKLRFLEAEGLVEPLRAPSGYRKYTAADLERLRFILTAQRDRYLPLRVIRDQLDAMDRGERMLGLPPPTARPAAPVAQPPPSSPAATVAPSARPATPLAPPPGPLAPPPAAPTPRVELGEHRLSRSDLAERSGLDESSLMDLERYGLLPEDHTGAYGPDALTIARIAAQLAGYGIEARHLRPYRTTADREVGLLSQLVPTLTRLGGLGGRTQAMETVHELAALCSQLHGALVRQGLREVLRP
jgi:DNA-binding transcriptional MerR regulator